MSRRRGVLQGKAPGAGTAPYKIPGQPLQPRAQSQGGAGRPSRPAGDPLDQPGLRTGKFLDGIGTARTGYLGGSAPGAKASQIPSKPAGAPALRRGPPRGPAAVRLPGKPGARARVFSQRAPARRRAADAVLFPNSQGSDSTEYDTAA